jgi:hypothetical protein
MTRDEVIELLQIAASYDRRTIGETDVTAWEDAAIRGRWTAQQAQEAIKRHYATSSAYLMPGHVTEALRALRQLPASAADQRRALPRPKMDPELLRNGVDRVFAALAGRKAIRNGVDPEDAADVAEGEAGARRQIRSVVCPHCKAGVGQPCVRFGRQEAERRPIEGYHPSRSDLAMGDAA